MTEAPKWSGDDESVEWFPIATAKEDGTLCWLKFRDPFGEYQAPGEYFLHEGDWFRREPPLMISARPVRWTYALREMT